MLCRLSKLQQTRGSLATANADIKRLNAALAGALSQSKGDVTSVREDMDYVHARLRWVLIRYFIECKGMCACMPARTLGAVRGLEAQSRKVSGLREK